MPVSRDVFLAIAVVCVAATSHAQERRESWSPPSRPDTARGVAWQFLGCRAGSVEYNCWIGEVSGHLCNWQRTSERGVIRREERYGSSGDFLFASETLEATGEPFSVIFFDGGRSYYRLSESPQKFTIGVVRDGHELARYESRWDRFSVAPDGVLWWVPMDAELVSGAPFAAIEGQHARDDTHGIAVLRDRGVDLTKPVTVSFGFWFAPEVEPNAKSELAVLGCKWISPAERGGAVGPFPWLCAKAVRMNRGELASWHRRFTSIARTYSGRYYGWTDQR